MKKTVNANLGGRVFQIEEDAYNMLETYIRNISALFQKEDPDGEIVQDFEQRLGDLLAESLYGEDAPVTVEMTQSAIRRLGPLEEIRDSNEYSEGYASAGSETEAPRYESQETGSREAKTEPKTDEAAGGSWRENHKRFYRDPDDKWIGGVLGGLGALMGIDPLLLRILFILLMFTPLSWVLIVIYITFWIFIPKAKTLEDKLRMEGRPVSSSEIWKKITEEASFAAGAASDGLNRVSRALSRNKDKGAEPGATNAAGTAAPKKRSRNDTIMYWVIGIALLLAVGFSIFWLFDYVGSGDFLNPGFSIFGSSDYETNNFFEGSGAVLMVLFSISLIFVIVMALIFLLFILPFGLIIRSKMSGLLKFVVGLIWLLVLGLILNLLLFA